MQKFGILGGTFNPIHFGHLLMAETALSQCKLDRILWVPTHQPPYRSPLTLIDPQHRLEMLRRAISPHPVFSLSTVDFSRPGKSYAIDTFYDLQSLYSNTQWFWIVGLDAFRSLPKWYCRQDLVPHCQWLVAPRLAKPGELEMSEIGDQVTKQLASQGIEIRWNWLDMPLMAISSSLIRQYCGDRRSIRYLVPDPVREYIATHQLYLHRGTH